MATPEPAELDQKSGAGPRHAWHNILVFTLATILLTGCAEISFLAEGAKKIRSITVPSPPPQAGFLDSNQDEQEETRFFLEKGEYYKVGLPYKIKGRWYYPEEDFAYVEEGIASWYGEAFHNKTTANGAIFNMNALTAAHRTLPMPSIVRVTNLENGRTLVVKVNDRGPFARDRIIDMSKRSATVLGFLKQGVTRVRVEILPEESRQFALIAGRKPFTSSDLKRSPAKAKAPQAAPQSVNVAQPQPEPAPEPAKTPNSADLLYIQVGAFSLQANARKIGDAIAKQGIPVIIAPLEQNGKTLFRVRAGPALTTQQAEALLVKIQSLGYDAAQIISDTPKS